MVVSTRRFGKSNKYFPRYTWVSQNRFDPDFKTALPKEHLVELVVSFRNELDARCTRVDSTSSWLAVAVLLSQRWDCTTKYASHG
jgi:hypothetical protein